MDDSNSGAGDKHGDWITYYANGNKRTEGHYTQGKKDGPWIDYWPNGNKMRECCFVNDRADGLCTAYYKNGKRRLQGRCDITAGTSVDGTKVGVWCSYADDGETVWRRTTYKQGSIVQDEALGEWPETSEYGNESRFLMLPLDPHLAPADVLVRYLAVLQRFLTAVIRYTVEEDIPGMFLVGWIAHTLHEIPEMLWYCDADYYHSPVVLSRHLDGMPPSIRDMAAPERLVSDYERILAAEGGARELGLREDLADLDLPPLPKVWTHLDLLYQACQSIGVTTRYSARPTRVWRAFDGVLDYFFAERRMVGGRWYSRRYTPWKGLKRVWTAQAQEKAKANRRMAEVLLPVPQALVRWSQFDEAQFRKAGRAAATSIEQEQLVWNVFYNEERAYPL